MIAYGSPSIASLLGRQQITLIAESAAMGFDPENGDVLWQTDWPGKSSRDANCSQVTRLSDDRIILSKAYGVGGEIVKLVEQGNHISTETIWENARLLRTKMMSPVILDDHAYYLSDGFMECCSISEDGEARRKWRQRDRFGNGQLLLVGNRLLIHTEDGRLKLVEASPDGYNEYGEIETIDGVCWNTICLYDNYLLVRSEIEAACIELKTEVQTAVAADPNSDVQSQTAESDEVGGDE